MKQKFLCLLSEKYLLRGCQAKQNFDFKDGKILCYTLKSFIQVDAVYLIQF